MSHLWPSHGTHMTVSYQREPAAVCQGCGGTQRTNGSCHTYEWVMSIIHMCVKKHRNESCHTSDRVISHTWPGHITETLKLCGRSEEIHTYEWVMTHIRIRNGIHKRYRTESCHTDERVQPIADRVAQHLEIISLPTYQNSANGIYD